jgi:DNA-binding XRE family transcriptional regulator
MDTQTFKAWRARLGLTQERASKPLGVSRRVVAGWETGTTPIPKMAALATWAIEHRRILEQQVAEVNEITG